MVKINLSFKENPLELKIYNYVKSKLNYSAYIKELILEDMRKKEEN